MEKGDKIRILFIEPPKEIWFVMGDYLAPPYGIIQLAAYLEREVKNLEIEVLDCNAQQIDWKGLEKKIGSFNPHIVASSTLATCNTYAVVRTLETAKKIDPSILTVAGGQHFTATAQESLKEYPVIDVIVRGEGEQTLAELVRNRGDRSSFPRIRGISFRDNGEVKHNPPRPLIEDLNSLPYPGYHFVKDFVHKYHFGAMAGRNVPFALIEGSRGCTHCCSFCSQWRHWQRKWRVKSPRRIADEMEFCYRNYGSRLIWLTDDNFLDRHAGDLADEIISRGISEDVMWSAQARCDDVVRNKDLLPKLRRAGLRWVLLGVENPNQNILESFRKDITKEDAKEAIKLLKKNDIFTHAMLIIGSRKDTSESIENLRLFTDELDPDFAIFTILTPFPGTELFEEAKRNGWIEDYNWSHYDMIHAIMPTETLSRKEVQEELYECYRYFYGSLDRRIRGLLSSNEFKRRIFLYMAFRGIVRGIRNLSR